MRHLAFVGIGIGFLLMGVALYALTLRKPPEPKAGVPTKTQLREQAMMADENKKMRIASACLAAVGALTVIVAFTLF